jgi:hypothetical protein
MNDKCSVMVGLAEVAEVSFGRARRLSPQGTQRAQRMTQRTLMKKAVLESPAIIVIPGTFCTD